MTGTRIWMAGFVLTMWMPSAVAAPDCKDRVNWVCYDAATASPEAREGFQKDRAADASDAQKPVSADVGPPLQLAPEHRHRAVRVERHRPHLAARQHGGPETAIADRNELYRDYLAWQNRQAFRDVVKP